MNGWRRRQPRLSSVQRGYDSTHRRVRRRFAALVNRGGMPCCRCGRPIVPGLHRWELDHADGAAAKALHIYRGVSHAAVTVERERCGNRGCPSCSCRHRHHPPAPALRFFDVLTTLSRSSSVGRLKDVATQRTRACDASGIGRIRYACTKDLETNKVDIHPNCVTTQHNPPSIRRISVRPSRKTVVF